jgi:hypothetical protein
MASRLIRNQLPSNGLRVRAPCPPLQWQMPRCDLKRHKSLLQQTCDAFLFPGHSYFSAFAAYYPWVEAGGFLELWLGHRFRCRRIASSYVHPSVERAETDRTLVCL